MSQISFNQMLYKKNLNQIKENLNCYRTSRNHLLRTNIISISKFIIIELYLKPSFKIIQSQTVVLCEKKLLNLLAVQKSQECFLFDNFSLKKFEKLFFVISFLKQIFLLNNFVKGRVYHFFKNGFIVILNGLVCFLPLNNCSYINFNLGKLNVFLISFFNELNIKTILLSQRNIHKKVHSTLLKLTSRLSFLKNSMADVTQLVRVLNCEFKRMSSILIVCQFLF
jgi:hypothetical protein